jgi:hypothetical protein
MVASNREPLTLIGALFMQIFYVSGTLGLSEGQTGHKEPVDVNTQKLVYLF